MFARFCRSLCWLDNFVRVGEEEFYREVSAIRSDLIQCYAALIQYGSQMQGVTPAFTAMFRSLSSIEHFHQEYARNRHALRLAMLECAVFKPFRAMLLHDEGWRALCRAINSMKQLHDLMSAVNAEAYFALYSRRRINDFQRAVDELLDDGHDIDGIQRSVTMCKNSLQSYVDFRELYDGSHAAIVSVVRNIHLPFVPDLPM